MIKGLFEMVLPTVVLDYSLGPLLLWQWCGVLLLALLGLFTSWLLALLSQRFIERVAVKLPVFLPIKHQVVWSSFRLPINFLLLGWVLLFCFSVVDLGLNSVTVLVDMAAVLSTLGVVLVLWQLSSVVHVWLIYQASLTTSKLDDILAPLLVRILRILVLVFAFVSLAELFNFPLTSLIAGLGIGGIAVAMAAKDIIANFFGSVTVLMDRPFHIGDWVKVDGVEGTVEEMGFRSTKIRTFYDSQITVPNSRLLTCVVDNMGARTYRRLSCKLGLVYETPAEKVEAFCEGVRELIRLHPKTRKDYFMVYLNEMNEYSVDVLLYCFFDVADWTEELNERHRLLLDIMRLAQTINVSFAYPTQQLLMSRSSSIMDPDPLVSQEILATQCQDSAEAAKMIVNRYPAS